MKDDYFIGMPFADGQVDDSGSKMANYKQKLDNKMIKVIIKKTN